MIDLSNRVRFIDKYHTPFSSKCGWMIPLKYNILYHNDLDHVFTNLGLIEGVDYKIHETKFESVNYITRVIFNNDDAFMMEKMMS